MGKRYVHPWGPDRVQRWKAGVRQNNNRPRARTAGRARLDCDRCERSIGRHATFYVLRDGRIACGQCLDRKAHRYLFPDCTQWHHDVLDHLDTIGTPTAAANAGRAGGTGHDGSRSA